MKRFYHGTNNKIGKIDLNRCRNRTDFGKGFYMGTNLGEARKWATSQSMRHETPTVMKYVLDDVIFKLDDTHLKRLWFNTPTVQWLDFVRDNRRIIAPSSSNREPRHDYDIVYGPIANDKVVDVVDEYIDGLINVDEAIRRVQVIQSVFQMSFHTPFAISFIKQESTEYQQRIKTNKWTEWKK
jgi:hypothetical protein